MTKDKLIQEAKPFTDACDKMLASKFIMIDKRVSDVLKSIANCQVVFDTIKECMVNFSFEREWKMAIAKTGNLQPPTEVHKFVAFVFSLLNNIDNQKINTSELLSKYFSHNSDFQSPYACFCENIVAVFKNSVMDIILGGRDVGEPVKKVQPKVKPQPDIDKDVLSRIDFLVKDLKDYVQGLKKLKKSPLTKGEMVEILNGFITAIKNKDVLYFKSYILAIKAAEGKDKEIDRRLIELTDIVYNALILG